MSKELINICDLSVSVFENNKEKFLVDHVDLQIPELSLTALVGASGSGKSTTALSILNLLPQGLSITTGEIFFRQENLLKISAERLRQIRGQNIGVVFQEPLYAFNPVFTMGEQVNEVLRFNTQLSSEQRRKRIYELFDLVGLNEPKQVSLQYPHQLSGGMRQRAMIAQAIAANPGFIIADEPTSNLDVTMQAKIMELFVSLKKQLSLSILLITHDLGLVRHFADRVAVMHKGKIVESGIATDVLQNPKDQYCQELIKAVGF